MRQDTGTRVLLLSSTLGLGHLRASEAVAEALASLDPSAELELLDFWSLMDPNVAEAAKTGYLDAVTGTPELYDHLYDFDPARWMEFFRRSRLPPPLARVVEDALERCFPGRNGFPTRGENFDQTLFLNTLTTFFSKRAAYWRFIRAGLVLWAYRVLARRLRERIEAFAPHVVIATQMMPAGVLSAVKRRGDLDGVPTVGVLTDFGVHDFWVHAEMDRYCVATDEMAHDLKRRGPSGSTVHVTGIPLMSGFRNPLPKRVARRALKLPTDEATVLVTGGGFGIGAMEALQAILEADLPCQVVVAASGLGPGDESLHRIVEERDGRVQIFQHDPDMATLVAASDVVVGKPGGLSVSEALACGRPFLAFRSLGGQESFNVAFLERHGVGRSVSGDSLAAVLRRWLDDPGELNRAQGRARALGSCEGAVAVAESILRSPPVPAAATASKRIR